MSDGTQKGAAMTMWRKPALAVLLVLTALLAARCNGIPGGGDTPAIRLPAPKTPKGPDTGTVGQALTYTTKGTDPLEVHDYMWDWGDGAELKWKSKAWEPMHTFAATGVYQVRVREKCPVDIFLSGWSDPKTVTITSSEWEGNRETAQAIESLGCAVRRFVLDNRDPAAYLRRTG